MKKFLKKNGYYFILIACVIAVCVGGIIVLEKRAADNVDLPEQLGNINNSNATRTPTATLKPSSADYVDPTAIPTEIATAPATEMPAPTETAVPEATQDTATAKPSYSEDDNSTEVNKPVDKNEETGSFSIPVGSLEIITEFADNKLVYNKTLKEWRIHPALDLSAEAGSNVVCVANGTVSDILSDPLYGTTVIIDHGNDLQTVYCGMGLLSGIETGAKLKKGDVIGTVSESGIFCERDLGSHIHFEVIQNGKKVNPIDFFDKKTSAEQENSENGALG